jgi:hypothetical protein
MLDVAVSYNRYKFLGNEFLTWLWFSIENEQGFLEKSLPQAGSIQIGNRIKLENNRNQNLETITIKGDEAGLEEGVLALRKGALVTELNIIYETQNLVWQFNIIGESLNIGNLKTQIDASFEKKEDIEEQVLEKTYVYNEVIQLVDNLYKNFITLRVSTDWEEKSIIKIKNWIFS